MKPQSRSDTSVVRLTRSMKRTADSGSNVRFRKGTVKSIQAGPPVKLTITVAGVDIPACTPLHSFNASVNDTVFLLWIDDVDVLVIGKAHE